MSKIKRIATKEEQILQLAKNITNQQKAYEVHVNKTNTAIKQAQDYQKELQEMEIELSKTLTAIYEAQKLINKLNLIK